MDDDHEAGDDVSDVGASDEGSGVDGTDDGGAVELREDGRGAAARDGNASTDGLAVDPERYAVGDDATTAEFLAAAKLYARAVVDAHDLSADVSALDWEVSKRAKRRAGAVTHRDGDPEAVSLTRAFFAARGWRETAAIVRHELIHVHLLVERDDPGHGARFRRWADRLDAPVRCERFSEPTWWVVCVDCGAQLARYRESKLVRDPGAYRCGDCGGAFEVRENEDA